MQDNQEVDKHHENALQSVEMLRAVIGGETYEAVAMCFGVSRTAVERRIKSVAVQLTQVVGVDGLKEEGARLLCGGYACIGTRSWSHWKGTSPSHRPKPVLRAYCRRRR